MKHRHFLFKGAGLVLTLLLTLSAAASVSADAAPRTGEGQGPECPPFTKTAPPDGSIVPADPILHWSSAFGATGYEICVDTTDDGICDSEWSSVDVSADQYETEGLESGATYYWQVRAVVWWGRLEANGGSWWSFSIEPDPPGAFGKSAPADLSTQPTDPILAWESSSGAESYEYCYDTSDDDACEGTWQSAGSATGAALNGLEYETQYYWQVRAHNAGGDAEADGGAWWSFTTESALPGAFGKIDPADGAFRSLDTSIEWAASAGAQGYEYCVDTIDNDACDSEWIANSDSTDASLSGLGNNVAYYWQVRAVNAAGNSEADGGDWWGFTARSQTFADVPIDHPFWAQIEAFYNAGITTGCGYNPLIYCPDRSVTRAEIAVFLERAMHYPDLPYSPPPASHFFADMPVAGKEWMEDWVDQFYRDGITGGCGFDPRIFCPERPLTRAEMAVFVLRALYGSGYAPPAASHFFADVPVAGKEWMEPWIDQFYREGITTGCGYNPLIYCPEDQVNRGEMAVFIVRAYDLPLP